MYTSILSATLHGLEAIPVQVEVDVSSGLPGFSMVGNLSSQVREAAERVRTALHNTGISLPFFSYGGSSLIMLFFEMGLILSASRKAKIMK